MEEPKIIAVRGGKIREFTRKAWDLIGTDKYGWVPVESMAPPVPKEVVGIPPVTIVGRTLEVNEPPAPTLVIAKPSKRKKK